MKKVIPIVGMACSACSANVERKLNSLEGINEASVSLPGRSALIDFNPEVISLEKMKHEINNIGYDMVIEADRSLEEIEKRSFVILKHKTILAWIFSIIVMSISMMWIDLGSRDNANQVAMIIALLTMIYCGRQFFIAAWKNLKHGSANMDTLVALSTSISFLFSVFNTFWGNDYWAKEGIEAHTYYDACVMIITFVLTGRLLEEKAKDGTASSIRQLMGMQPKTARIVVGDNIDDVPISTIEKGDILEVRAGDKIPVDGVVTMAESFMNSNAAYVDESMITGEPTPSEKIKGSNVIAGTIPNQGKIRMKAMQIGEDTAIAHIIRMVELAQGSKAPVQRIVDRAALVFVPVIVVLSLITFLSWWLIGGSNFLPQAIISAISVLVIACPCALGLATPTALMVGIGKAAREQVLIKDATALEKMRKVNAVVIDKTGTLTIPNKNIDFTNVDGLSLEDRERLKPNAKEAMTELQNMGVEIYMMSGDKEEAARFWAEKAGITNYKSKALPQDKENIVMELQKQGKTVAMVGDGINDTQALALADVSIAIGNGTDVAMDVAQVTLLGDDLRNIPKAIRLSGKTVKMIWENLFWAFIYNIICIPLAAGVMYIFGINFQITPMWSSALMAFSSVSVVLNSLRLKYTA